MGGTGACVVDVLAGWRVKGSERQTSYVLAESSPFLPPSLPPSQPTLGGLAEVDLALALHLGRLGAEQPGLVHQVHLGDGGAPCALV